MVCNLWLRTHHYHRSCVLLRAARACVRQHSSVFIHASRAALGCVFNCLIRADCCPGTSNGLGKTGLPLLSRRWRRGSRRGSAAVFAAVIPALCLMTAAACVARDGFDAAEYVQGSAGQDCSSSNSSVAAVSSSRLVKQSNS